MPFWITKYALTMGILQKEADEPDPEYPDTLVYRGGRYSEYFHGEGKDWHRDLGSAARRAESMRQKKIASLRKQIAKLEALRFPGVP